MMQISTLPGRLCLVLPGFWGGIAFAIAAFAAPAAFSSFAPADAGRYVGQLLRLEAYVSLAFSALLLILERRAAKQAVDAADPADAPSIFSGQLLLVLSACFLTVLGQFGVPMQMEAARAGASFLTFAQWHMVAVACYLSKLLAVLALAWRASRVPPSRP